MTAADDDTGDDPLELDPSDPDLVAELQDLGNDELFRRAGTRRAITHHEDRQRIRAAAANREDLHS